MKHAGIVVLFALTALFPPASSSAAETALVGPVKYDVKERYGKVNKYEATFTASEGMYLVRLQNGEKQTERADLLELSLNGAAVLRDDRYPYRFIACFVQLRQENRLEIAVKDERPSGLKRPPAVPKNVVVTVLPVSAELRGLKGCFGLFEWERLGDLSAQLRKIKAPAAELAMDALSLHLAPAARADAIRKLADLKEKSAADFLAATYGDPFVPSEVVAESAIAIALLGDVKQVPVLAKGITNPDDRVSVATARALSLYPEDATEGPFVQALSRLDNIRRPAAIRVVLESGWKPVKALKTMTGSKDPYVASTGIELLGALKDPRATDVLLDLLKTTSDPAIHAVIKALGGTSDPRAVTGLISFASDMQQRSGREIDLADALAALRDQRAGEVIGDMIKKAPSSEVEKRLRSAYRRLMKKGF